LDSGNVNYCRRIADCAVSRREQQEIITTSKSLASVDYGACVLQQSSAIVIFESYDKKLKDRHRYGCRQKLFDLEELIL
jgi:hypothetical protein